MVCSPYTRGAGQSSPNKHTDMPAKKKEEVAQYNWDQYEGGTGLENLTTQDLGTPILQIVQKGSPEYDEDHEDHATKAIKGVKVGDIINSVTRKILFTQGEEPVKVVPYFYQLVYLEWRPREQGGGLVATHTDPSILSRTTRDKESNKDVLPNGNHVVTTAYFFVRLLGETEEDALLSLTSTQLKKSRLWLNMMRNFRQTNGNPLPMFHRAYYLSTIPESNAKGTWRGWKIEPAPAPLSDQEVVGRLLSAVRDVHTNAVALIGASSNAQLDDQDIV